MNSDDHPSAPVPLEDIDAIKQRLDRGADVMARLGSRQDDLDRGQLEILRRMDLQDAALLANTTTTDDIKRNTGDIVDFFNAMQGAFKVFNLIGRVAKPVWYIAAAVGSILAAVAAWKALRP